MSFFFHPVATGSATARSEEFLSQHTEEVCVYFSTSAEPRGRRPALADAFTGDASNTLQIPVQSGHTSTEDGKIRTKAQQTANWLIRRERSTDVQIGGNDSRARSFANGVGETLSPGHCCMSLSKKILKEAMHQ